jgi:hypothetical protein
MKRVHSPSLVVLALAVLAVAITFFILFRGGFCPAAPSDVVSSVTTDSLSAVSGTDLALKFALKNPGTHIKEGSAIISITRESQKGDFSQGNEFVVARIALKEGVALPQASITEYPFVWRIPSGLPTGLYRIDPSFIDGGMMFDQKDVAATPFGGSARVFIKGEADGAVYFIAGTSENDEPSIVLVNATEQEASIPVTIKLFKDSVAGSLITSETRTVSIPAGSTQVIEYALPSEAEGLIMQTAYRSVPSLYVFSPRERCVAEKEVSAWAMAVGGLGVVILLLVYPREKKVRSSKML